MVIVGNIIFILLERKNLLCKQKGDHSSRVAAKLSEYNQAPNLKNLLTKNFLTKNLFFSYNIIGILQ